MLHTETVEPGTFSLLKKLMELPLLQPFSLVGGTALSLRYGHRSSVDIDMFCHEKFDQPQLVKELEAVFQDKFVYKQQQTQFGIFCFIEEVKVDFVHYPHPLIGNSGATAIYGF
ncbi:MAG: nucleotidyl transferase AbiEii/AbiGii toxin family protein [Bacteroidales bacterium]|nr:nucleotidyl transferase AbiEii/AbiGii toxin family protein [Bacteroidales bacterium]